MSPLPGITGRGPSCLNGPVKDSDICRGGDDIEFKLETAGTSNNVMHVKPTSISSPESPQTPRKYSCQACPTGAVCNGSALQGKIEGSMWVPDFSAGVYFCRAVQLDMRLG